jgi:hypothetical protein
MLLLSSGKLPGRDVIKQVAQSVDLVFSESSQLNDRKYRTLQNEINAL